MSLITPGMITELKFGRMPSESEPRNDRQPDNKVKHTAVVYFMALSRSYQKTATITTTRYDQ